MKNCKNCGAPLESLACEYCGTQYEPDEVYDNYVVLYGDNEVLEVIPMQN